MVYIIDKNPRKPRKEGPKAQQKYVDELGAEWLDGHVLNQAPPERGEEPDLDTQARYHVRTLEALDVMDKIAADREVAAAKTAKIDRRIFLARKRDMEIEVFGHVREDTQAELDEIND